MASFLVDEDLPRSLVARLKAAGLAASDVRDIGLRGQPDDVILRHCVVNRLVLLTADVGFGNVLRFPLGSHPGIVVARFPNETPINTLNDAMTTALVRLGDQDFEGNLLVIEPGRVRLRRRN